MRDAPIESWQPQQNCEYFAHVCSSHDAMGVGLSLCHVSSGLVPAHLVPAPGVDTDPNAGSDGSAKDHNLHNLCRAPFREGIGVRP